VTAESWYWVTVWTAFVNVFLVGKAASFYWRSLEPEHRATAKALTALTIVLIVFVGVTASMASLGIPRRPWVGTSFQVGLNIGFGWLYYKLYFNGPSTRRKARR
jgi:hypothetical protein